MWCPSCQQDVPGVVASSDAEPRSAIQETLRVAAGDSSAAGRVVCPRCACPLGNPPEDDDLGATARPRGNGSNPASFETWQWELDQDLHDVRRLLETRAPKAASSEGGAAVPPPDPSEHLATLALHAEPRRVVHSAHRALGEPAGEPSASGAARGAWLVLSLGLMGLACGGVLLGWSMIEGRVDLWQLGLPVALGSQAVLLVGFLMLLERIWRDSRTASAKLHAVDGEIDDLRNTTSILGQTQSRGSQSFYTHMAEGASPSLLLSDLKGQLDMLSVKISDRQS